MASKNLFILTMLLLTQAEPSAWSGEIFRWLDQDGTPHFTDNPSKIPPAYRNRAEVLSIPDQPTQEEPIAPLDSFDLLPQTDSEGRDEPWWREQIQTWRSRKEEAALKLSEAEEKLGRLQFDQEAPSYRTAETNRLRQEVEKYKQEVRQAQEMLEIVLPDEARKAGVPPGWLR
ncbi:MAG: DUF4124 domain-containing protein [Candidatus Manganitrophaceae bacterium]|nr:MAG: DUF4124 domain-containing protein [Candidatus Manganitrophaceae bacterium]